MILKIAKKQSKPKPKLVSLMISPADMRVIKRNAKKYAGGNVSLWLRYSGTKFRPTLRELDKK